MEECNVVGVTYLGVEPCEGRVILVHLEADLRGGDGEGPTDLQQRADQPGRAAQHHRA